MDIVILISLTVFLPYAFWAIKVHRGFKSYTLKPMLPEVNFKPISVVIPCRNEAPHLPALLASIQKLDYPKALYEVILVDDHSTDGSANIINQTSDFIVVSLTGQGKKEAQRLGISMANHETIACTDADCTVPPNWLKDINSAMRQNVELVFGPVVFSGDKKPFMALEFLALVGSTMGMLEKGFYVMGNGANMAFKKSAFLAVTDKLEGMKTPSGDDVFLLHEVAKNKGRIETLSGHAIVQTQPPSGLKAFIDQRVRWASKGRHYTSTPTILVGLLVFAINSWLLLLFILAFFKGEFWMWFLLLFASKTILDTVLLTCFGKTFQQKVTGFLLIGQQIMNLIYVPLIAVLSLFKSYNWKGRRY